MPLLHPVTTGARAGASEPGQHRGMSDRLPVPPRVRRAVRAAVLPVTLALAGAAVPPAAVATPDVRVGVTIEGEIRPGVYGRVEIGQRPPPVLVYPQPVVVVSRPVAVAPVYLHVPPGHAKRWSKHCHRYDACGVPVYFVRSAEYRDGWDDDDRRGRGRGGDDDHGPGKGHGKGRGHGHD